MAEPTKEEQLQHFFDECVKHFGPDDFMQLDYCDFTDLALNCGLIHFEAYDPEKHGEVDAVPGEDEVWVVNG